MTKKRGSKTKLALLFIGLCSSSAIASTAESIFKDTQWVIDLSGGAAWADAGKTQTFNLTPSVVKTYSAQNTTNALPQGELFVGLQKPWLSTLKAQLGLAVATTGNAKLTGNIWDDADPQFNNYSYQYKISHTRVSLKGKLLADEGYFLTPWISASIGIGFNYAKDYTNTPLIPEAVATPNFSSNTKTSFTYSLGIGAQKALNTNWQAGIGYEFADWGKSQLGSASQQTQNSGLALNHLYTNSLLFNITYLK